MGILRNISFIVIVAHFTMGCAEQEIALFNGESLEGWTMDVPMFDSIPNAPRPFVVHDGNLVSLGEPRGHLVSDKSFRNYRLEVEYRFTGTPGNCGVLVHASAPRALYKMFPKSIEVQMEHENAGDFWVIVEDIEVENMVKYRGPEELWGITEGENRRIMNLQDDLEKPLGEWNTMTIECFEDQIKVWVNGVLANHGFNATVSEGKIAIQAEGSEVAFRKLLLTPINQISID